MAEADPLIRVRIAALRAIEVDSVDDRRRAHYDALHRDLGLDAESVKARAVQARRRRLPRQIVRFVVAALSLSGLWLGVPQVQRMWNAGAYDGYAATLQRAAPRPDGGWIGTRKPGQSKPATSNAPASADADAPNFMEQALQAAKAPPPAPVTLPLPVTEAADDSDDSVAD